MSRRQTHIDAAKVLASHLIVLHHFTVYGPLAVALDAVAPRLTDWFFDYARMAVQVFLVIGGYLAAGTLAPHGYLQHAPLAHRRPAVSAPGTAFWSCIAAGRCV